ncbi:MAG: OadG family transporter subunit [Planctomycetota bacterium]
MQAALGQSELQQALTLTLVGVGVVASALVILMLTVIALGRLLRDKPAQPKPVATPSPAAAATAPVVKTAPPTAGEPAEDPLLVVVLAAAAAAALGRPAGSVRVRRFARASDDWVAAGRRTLMAGAPAALVPGRKPSP